MLVGLSQNECGTPVSVHVCDTCGNSFTVCPAAGNKGWENCLGEGCPSYDAERDVDMLFETAPETIHRRSPTDVN